MKSIGVRRLGRRRGKSLDRRKARKKWRWNHYYILLLPQPLTASQTKNLDKDKQTNKQTYKQANECMCVCSPLELGGLSQAKCAGCFSEILVSGLKKKKKK